METRLVAIDYASSVSSVADNVALSVGRTLTIMNNFPFVCPISFKRGVAGFALAWSSKVVCVSPLASSE